MRQATGVYLESVMEVLNRLRQYWPLTLRQVYYQLVQAGDIENNRNEYQRLSRVLVKARLQGLVKWDAIEDRSRSLLNSGGWGNAATFKQNELDDFLAGYRRDLLQNQEVRPEIWVEKDALSRIIHDVAIDYCVHVVVARGFSSLSFKHQCAERIFSTHLKGQTTKILYFGDLDPSGWEMLPAMMKTLQEDLSLHDWVQCERVALIPEQVDRYQLPTDPDALKDTDPRAKKYRRQFGNLAVELDALSPAVLQDMVKQAIKDSIDLDHFAAEQRAESEELGELQTERSRVIDLLGGCAA